MRHIVLALFALLTLNTFAQGEEEYTKEFFVSTSGDTLQYRELTPLGAGDDRSTKKYPLVIFMHGSGERGDDNTKQLTHGSQMFLNPYNREYYPAYVLFAQCPEDHYWAYDSRPVESLLPMEMPSEFSPSALIVAIKELIESYVDSGLVDSRRVYIIGMSMGGMATYDLTSRYPELFAAAVPICGTVYPKRMESASGVNFWIFHGDSDSVVPVDGSRQAYLSLRSVGAKVRYTEFAGCDHNSWTPAFNHPEFMEWIFSQKKKGR